MKNEPLVQGRTESPVQAVLKVELTPPLHDVREQIPVEGGVLGQQRAQVKLPFRAHELVQPDLPRRDLGPVARRQTMLGIGTPLTHRLEDHPPSLRRRMRAEKDT